jgi:hypothetical protein
MGDETGEDVKWVQREPGVSKNQLKRRHCMKYCNDGRLYPRGQTCPYVCKHGRGKNKGCPMMDDQGDMVTLDRMQTNSRGQKKKLKGRELRKMCPKPCPDVQAVADPKMGCPFTCPDRDGRAPRMTLEDGREIVELFEIDDEADKDMPLTEKKEKYCPQYCGPAPAEFPPEGWDEGEWPTEVGDGESCWSMCPDGTVLQDESDECPPPETTMVACPNIVMIDEKGNTCSAEVPWVEESRVQEDCPSQCLSEMDCATGTLGLHYPEYKCTPNCEPGMTPLQCGCQLKTPFCPEKCVDETSATGEYMYHLGNIVMTSQFEPFCPKYCRNEWKSELPSSGSDSSTGVGHGYGSGHDSRDLAWHSNGYACPIPCRNSDGTVMMSQGYAVIVNPVMSIGDVASPISEGEALASCPVKCPPPEGGCTSDNKYMCEQMGHPLSALDGVPEEGTSSYPYVTYPYYPKAGHLSDDGKREEHCPKFCSSPTAATIMIYPIQWSEGQRCPHDTTTTMAPTMAQHRGDECMTWVDEWSCHQYGVVCTWNDYGGMGMCENGRQDHDQRYDDSSAFLPAGGDASNWEQPANDGCIYISEEWSCMPPCSWNPAMYMCESGRQDYDPTMVQHSGYDCMMWVDKWSCHQNGVGCTWNVYGGMGMCESGRQDHDQRYDDSSAFLPAGGNPEEYYAASNWP